MVLIELLKDKYLTWKTGKTKEERIWQAWKDETIHYRAATVEDYFYKFKHIIEVDPHKFFTQDAMAWIVVDDIDQYMWPQRELGDNVVYSWQRVIYNDWSGKHDINEIGGGDKVFVATNNSQDAIMIALKYA